MWSAAFEAWVFEFIIDVPAVRFKNQVYPINREIVIGVPRRLLGRSPKLDRPQRQDFVEQVHSWFFFRV